jgi:hypothetical protein
MLPYNNSSGFISNDLSGGNPNMMNGMNNSAGMMQAQQFQQVNPHQMMQMGVNINNSGLSNPPPGMAGMGGMNVGAGGLIGQKRAYNDQNDTSLLSVDDRDDDEEGHDDDGGNNSGLVQSSSMDRDRPAPKKKGRKKSFIWAHVVTDEFGKVHCKHCGALIRVNYGEKVERLRRHFIKNCPKNPFNKDSKEYEELLEAVSAPASDHKRKNYITQGNFACLLV